MHAAVYMEALGPGRRPVLIYTGPGKSPEVQRASLNHAGLARLAVLRGGGGGLFTFSCRAGNNAQTKYVKFTYIQSTINITNNIDLIS